MLHGRLQLERSQQKSDFNFVELTTFNTVDGRNPANQLRLVVDLIISRVLYIAGGCLGFFSIDSMAGSCLLQISWQIPQQNVTNVQMMMITLDKLCCRVVISTQKASKAGSSKIAKLRKP